jgi:hypothetical protein
MGPLLTYDREVAMGLNEYTAGQSIKFTTLFSQKPTGATPVDPTEVLFYYQVGTGAPVRYKYGTGTTIVRNGTGEYEVVVNTTGFATATTGPQPMKWLWASDGTGKGNATGVVLVKPPAIQPTF